MKRATKRRVNDAAGVGVIAAGGAAVLELVGLGLEFGPALGLGYGVAHYLGAKAEAEHSPMAVLARAYQGAAGAQRRSYARVMAKRVVLWGGKPGKTVQFGSDADHLRELTREHGSLGAPLVLWARQLGLSLTSAQRDFEQHVREGRLAARSDHLPQSHVHVAMRGDAGDAFRQAAAQLGRVGRS